MNGRVLVAYSNSSNYTSTTVEYLDSISRYSKFDVQYLHVTNGAEIDFDLNEYDVIFQSYCARLPFDGYVSPQFIQKLKSFRGIKLIAVQDEYDRTDRVRQAVREIGYHVFFSVVPPKMLHQIYPPTMFPKTDFVSILTGYVSERLKATHSVTPLTDRPVIIGYRGRDIGARYGTLAFEKMEIGRRMRRFCEERAIKHDIEWIDEKRIYGEAWYQFIGSCRTILGSESGSNVFDFDGAIEKKYAELSAAAGGPVPYDAFHQYTACFENKYDMRQISPRIFEAAAMRTPMILFSGRYSGLLEPGEHFIELNKDFSNADSVFAQIHDVEALEQLAERAYEHLIGSGKFSYRRFVELVDATIEQKSAELCIELRPRAGSPAQDDLSMSFLASFREYPTASPRHPIFFWYKHLVRDQAAYPPEISRLNLEISRLNSIIEANQHLYSAETHRLNIIISDVQREYTSEVQRLNGIISNIQRDYTSEVQRLNGTILDLQRDYTAEVQRLNMIIFKRSEKGEGVGLRGGCPTRSLRGRCPTRSMIKESIRRLFPNFLWLRAKAVKRITKRALTVLRVI